LICCGSNDGIYIFPKPIPPTPISFNPPNPTFLGSEFEDYEILVWIVSPSAKLRLATLL
jgi:hypothetical protein